MKYSQLFSQPLTDRGGPGLLYLRDGRPVPRSPVQERRKMQVALEDGAEINASDGASNGESLGPFDATVLMKLLKSHIDEKEKVKILTDVGTECSLTLPSETSNFPALFLELEKNKNEFFKRLILYSSKNSFLSL